MVYATGDGIGPRRLRIGMVGGGRNAFIGAVHRMALRLDDRAELVAGALSSDSENARLSALDIGIAEDRAYADYRTMAEVEAKRPDGIEAVVIVTPNHVHAPVARAFLQAGIDVICDKPLSATLKEAEDLAEIAKKSGLVFAVTLNNTGYAMVRHARELVASGALGAIRIVRAEYIQDWLTLPIDADGQKQAEWRTDPGRAGRSACLADIGVHAFSLAQFVSGMVPSEVAADLTTFVPGRRLDDNAHVLMRYASGARGVLVASQVSPGNYNRLSIKVYGDKAGLEWHGHEPEYLRFCEFGKPHVILTRGGAEVGGEAARVSRMPAEHPEGYVEGFGNLYRDAIGLISARRSGVAADPSLLGLVPSVRDGLIGMRFIEASVDSHEAGGVWTPIATQL
ncbi:Gfo/Idh/MocA family oxidoreductase [Mesorhizobium sp. VNQ89]|uniref:Gfo/Idh/MocA family protein n=1 Tax=Mesorhizobium quangtriensis TaxID=3157709 RepID=UPI0032B85DE3